MMSLSLFLNTPDVEISAEFESVKCWANENKMIINLLKTKELVFHRPKSSKTILPPCLTSIERISVAKLLGVFIDSQFRFSEHINFILRQCSQRMFTLRTLQRRGLNTAALEAVFNYIVLSRVLYAVSAWGGFVNAVDRSRVDKLLARAKSYKYCGSLHCFDTLLERADSVLFRKAQSSGHCLNSILPAVRLCTMTLRERGHPYTLPICKNELFKKSFINRSLFKFL